MSARVKFDSTTLASASYDYLQSRLQLDFGDGACYTYSAVAPALFNDLISAPSKGKFFNQHIRGRFPYARMVPKN